MSNSQGNEANGRIVSVAMIAVERQLAKKFLFMSRTLTIVDGGTSGKGGHLSGCGSNRLVRTKREEHSGSSEATHQGACKLGFEGPWTRP